MMQHGRVNAMDVICPKQEETVKTVRAPPERDNEIKIIVSLGN